MEGQTTSQPPPESNQDDEDPPKVDLPEQLQKIVPATELPPSLNRWNTNEEIASILIAFDQHKEWLLDKPRVRPASGSLLMYNRKKVMFRRDGYCWKKRRDGKTNREDHMKLKVKGAECIYGSYVHSAILPTFHRRCYWLLQNPNVVLVHYLNVPNPPNNPKPSQMPSLSGEMRKKEWTKEELVDQLRPMLASDRQGELNPDQDLKVEETLEAIFQRLVSSQEDRGGAKPLAVEGGHHQHPCALAAPHSCCNPRPAVKQELACLQQQQGNQLGGCVSTMAHVQVSANTLSHHHPLQQALPLPTAVSTMATVPALSGSHHGDLHLLTATPGVLHHGALPTTTVSTSQSQLTLATFSHMHLAASSSSTSSPSSLSLRSIPASVESQLPHLRPSAPVNAPSPSVIPSSVNLLTGLARPDQYPGVAILPPGSVPVVSQSFPSMVDSGLFKPREQGLSAALSMTTTTSMNHSVVSLPGHPGSSVVHLHPSGLVAKEEDGALSSVVVFTSAHNPSVPTSHFGSISQVAHAHTQPTPLPGPSKDIPLFAANPLTHCGNNSGCDEAAGCAEENGISGGGDGGGVVGVDVVAGLTDAGDNCDTLDGSFSSLPSTDLNLDLFLDLQDLEDCAADLAAATSLSPPQLPPSPSSPLGSSSSLLPLATSSPLMAGRDMNIGTSSSSIIPASHHNHHHQHHHHQHTLDVMSGSYLNNSTSPNAQLSQSLSGDDDNSKQAFPPGCVWEGSMTPQHLTDASLSPPPSQTPHHDVIAHHLGVLNSCGVKVVDIGSFLLQQPQGCTKNSSSSSAPSANSANICDFSPEWAYAQSNTKVLVAGPWCNVTAVYTCVFDDKHVAATLIQPGVLRCFTPDHKAGRVSLKVAQDGQVISNSPVFEFRDSSQPSSNPQPEPPMSAQTDWFDTSGAHLKQLLLERLGELERRFISGEKSSSLCSTQNLSVESPEASLLAHVELLMKQQWSTDHLYPKAGLNGLTLLHLASAQGYAKLISALIRWRSCNSSPALEYEVDAHSVDNQACTPLMWACAKGQIDAALTLYHWNGGALGVCNKDGQLPLALARQRGHHNLAAQVEQLEQAHFKTPAPAPAKIRCQNIEAPSSSPAGSTDSNPLPQPMSPDTVKVEQPEGDGGGQGNDQDAQPMQTCQLPSSVSPLPPLPPPPPGPGKLIRRFSEQVISPSASSSHHPLSKRYSVDLLTSDTKGAANAAPPAAYHMRDSSSEPRLPLKPEAEFEGSLHEGQTQRVPSLTFVLEPDSLLGVRRKVAGSDRSFLSPLDPGQLPMDTDEGSSRSDSPFIDVERVSSDEEAEKQDDSKHQMVTLANQIIAAMPERIKLSPSKGDDEDDGCSVRTRSESHSSSAPSQGSPRPSSSSFGDDSGISTPMTDNLAFEEYRYTDFGTPASSLSPDSTCLPSPYSPYSFALDSPPPTTADFTEYFNAPATYMEKDFSQLTLSDQEQRKLYEAAKVIQNAYRHYRDKQQQQQHQKEIEAAVLIQSYYRRYKQYAYYKKMTHAAVLIQNQFRSYSAQKRKKNPGGSTQGSRRELERLKKGRNQSVIIQQRFRSHYQRKSLDGKEGTSAMGVGAGDAPDSSPPSEEVQQAASHDRSPTADEPGTADVGT